MSRSWILPVVVLVLASLPGRLGAQGTTPPPPPPSAAPKLERELVEFFSALDKALLVEGQREELAFRLHLYPNAWHYEILERLREGLHRGRSPEDVRAELRALKKSVRAKLERTSVFRLELRHPSIKEEYHPEDRQPVHFFNGRVSESIAITLDNRELQWQVLKRENLQPLRQLRVARHKTVKNRALVPFVSPMKPTHARLVFWGKVATLHGLFNRKVLEKNRGTIGLRLTYEDFFGQYDDRHIVDLENESNIWKPEVRASERGDLPLHLPPLPRRLEQFIQSVDSETHAEG